MIGRPPSQSTRQRGIAATEFAIVLPLVAFLLLAGAELGRAFFQYNALTKAVRDGARYAAEHALEGSTEIVSDPIPTALVDTVRNLVVYGAPNGGGEPLLPDLAPDDVTVQRVDAFHVRVDASYSFIPIFGGTLPTFGLGGGEGIDISFTFNAGSETRGLN